MANNASDDKFYKGDTLTKAFAISSIVLLVFTLWMILDDFGREWKGYQSQFMVLKQKKFQEQLETAKAGIDEAKLKEARETIAKSEKELEGKSKQVAQIEKELVNAKTTMTIATVAFQGEKIVWDVEKYEHEAKYGHKIAEGHMELSDPKAKTSYDALMKHWEGVQKLRNVMNAKIQVFDASQLALTALYTEKTKAEKEIKSIRAQLDLLESSKEKSEITMSVLLRNSPLIDMASPTFRLQQIVLPTIRDDIYFSQVQKVDRCTTCHLAMDMPGFEKEAQPFRTHPKLDLMLGSTSPHPIDKIGCTVCHEGRGTSTDFIRAAHTPRNEEQKKEWEKKYHWAEEHHTIEKMIPLQYTEGKCRVCHKSTEYVPRAEKLTRSVQTIRGAGCFGCHRIEGWDHIRKPAPSLKKVKGKLTRDWIVKWVKKPTSYNQWARMPAQFHQGNITTDDYRQYQDAELNALSDYILAESEDYKPNFYTSLGSKERGKELFGVVGCLGCHQIDDFARTRGRWTQAPDLSTVGSKVSKDWLMSWLKNPKHYWEETLMPSLRLSDGEIGDLSAYLLSKRNEAFEKLEPTQTDIETQKKVLKLYLMRDPKMAPATEVKVDSYIAELKPHEVKDKLGKAAMTRYGCYGCHEFKGFEKSQGNGVELSEWGSKPTNKLDFGLQEMEHSNYNWAHGKLANTRIWDKGVVKEYLDLLRMPNYEMIEEDRNSVVTALMGMTALKVTPPAAKLLSSRETIMEEGQRIVHKYNCQGCHMIEGIYQALPEDHPDREAHEKQRWDLEGRILSYYPEDETLGPPPLVSEGSRVRSDWVHAFFNNPSHRLRVKLKVRMPSFQMSNDEVNKIVSYWAAQGNLEFPVAPLYKVSLTPVQLGNAKALFNKLQCTTCHTVGRDATPAEIAEEGSSKGLAPNLARAHGRLNKDWIVQLLKEPGKMVPGTRMPGYWPDMQSPAPEIMGGNSQAQMELLADYVLLLGQGNFSTKPTESMSPVSNLDANKGFGVKIVTAE